MPPAHQLATGRHRHRLAHAEAAAPAGRVLRRWPGPTRRAERAERRQRRAARQARRLRAQLQAQTPAINNRPPATADSLNPKRHTRRSPWNATRRLSDHPPPGRHPGAMATTPCWPRRRAPRPR